MLFKRDKLILILSANSKWRKIQLKIQRNTMGMKRFKVIKCL